MHRSALAIAAVVLAASVAMLWWFVTSEPVTTHASFDPATATRAQSADALSPGATEARADVGEAARAAREVVGSPLESEDPHAGSASSPKSRIVGRVLDAAHRPLAGVDVLGSSSHQWNSLSWSSLPLDIEPEALPRLGHKIARTRTDADGRFVFEGLPSGPFRVVARAHGWVPARPAPMPVPIAYREFEVPDLVMTAASVVSGKVIDEAGQGIGGARVLLAVDGSKSRGSIVIGRGVVVAHTAADGSFVADELLPGPYQLNVDAPGYCIGTFAGQAGAGSAGAASGGAGLDSASPVVIQLARGAEIRGVVRGIEKPATRLLRVSARRAVNERDANRSGQSFGAPPPEMPSTADVRARDAVCDADGKFAISGLVDGLQYRLSAWTRTDETQDWKRLEGADTPVVPAGEQQAEIQWTPLSSLVLRVVDGVTRAPVEAFTIWAGVGREALVRNENNEARREHPGGRVRCGDLRTQKGGKAVELRISAAGYKDFVDKDVDVLPGAEVDLGDIALERCAVVRVHVVAAATGAPIPGARVWLTTKTLDELADALRVFAERDNVGDPDMRLARTDASGDTRLSGFPGRAALIAASAPGWSASEPRALTFAGDDDLDHTISLTPSGTVLVHVADASQAALSGVRVQCRLARASWDRSDSDAMTWKETDSAGDARFENLTPGLCSFRVVELSEDWDSGDDEQETSDAWVDARVVAGEIARVGLAARSRGSIRGRVSESGTPLPGAHLRLFEAVAMQSGRVSDRDWASAENPLAAVADEEGRYEYTGMPCAGYVLFVSHPSRRMAARFELSIEPGSREIDLTLDAAGIEGRVSDADGNPLAGAEVRIARADRTADPGQPYAMVLQEDERGSPRTRYLPIGRAFEKTDRQGRFTLHGVAVDEPLAITVRAEGYAPKTSDELVLAPNEVRRGVDFALREAGCIAVTLSSAGALPKGPNGRERWYEVRAELIVGGKRERAASTQLSASKRNATLCSLTPGRYRVVCAPRGRAEGAEVLEQELDVASGETASASFHLP